MRRLACLPIIALAAFCADALGQTSAPSVMKPRTELAGHTGPVTSVAYSPDGKRLVSAGADSTVKIWDVAEGKVIKSLVGHGTGVVSVAISPDGKQIASCSLDGSARVWDAESGALVTAFTGHTQPPSKVAFMPDGKRVATAGWDQTVRIWDAVNGEERRAIPTGAVVLGLAVSPDGKQIITGHVDSKIRIWNADTGDAATNMNPEEGPVLSVNFSQDGKRFASGGNLIEAVTPQATPVGVPSKGSVRIWNVQNGRTILQLRGHEKPVTSVAFSADGKWLVSGSQDGAVRLWDATSGKTVAAMVGHEGGTQGVAFSPDGKQFASAGVDQLIKIWDVPGASSAPATQPASTATQPAQPQTKPAGDGKPAPQTQPAKP